MPTPATSAWRSAPRSWLWPGRSTGRSRPSAGRSKRGTIKALAEGAEKAAITAAEKAKAAVRAFVEHPFHIVKNLFRHRKVRYRGLAKNGHQLYTLFGLANVVIGARTPAAA